MKKLFLQNLVDQFQLEVLSGADKLATTQINVYGLNRAGLELTGFFAPGDHNASRVVLVSSKEYNYVSQFDEPTRIQKYEALMNSKIPGIIVTKKFLDSTLLKTAQRLDFPLLKTNHDSTPEITQRLLDYFDEFFAPQTELHASLVNIYGKGILITGISGIGKSEVTLDLVKKNHMFVGDDRIVVTNKNNRIYGKSHPILRNLVEVRGIGIMDISLSNGYQVIMEETEINLVIELFTFQTNEEDTTDRLGNEYLTTDILGVAVPIIRIPVSSGRNVANIVESAVAQLKINESGTQKNVFELLAERQADGECE